MRTGNILNPETGYGLTICGLYDLAVALHEAKPDLVLSIVDPDPESRATRDMALSKWSGTTIMLEFHDIDRVSPGFIAPTTSSVRLALESVRRDMPANGRLLVHCHAGQSRSPALAILAMASLAERDHAIPDKVMDGIVKQVCDAAPHAQPNRRILEIGERLLPGWRDKPCLMGDLVEWTCSHNAWPFSW